MVAGPARAHRVLLEHAQARGGLAGVEDLGLGACHGRHVGRGQGGDRAHALHEVQGDPLAHQDGAGVALDHRGDGALLDPRAFLEIGGEDQAGIDPQPQAADHLEAADHAGRLVEEVGPGALALAHDGLGAEVPPAPVLAQGGV
ncbi:hypothetical protein D3C86_1600170 [compost metagenome]